MSKSLAANFLLVSKFFISRTIDSFWSPWPVAISMRRGRRSLVEMAHVMVRVPSAVEPSMMSQGSPSTVSAASLVSFSIFSTWAKGSALAYSSGTSCLARPCSATAKPSVTGRS